MLNAARPVCALALLALALGGCGGGPTIPRSKLGSLVLAPSDLPRSFVAFDSGPQVRLDNSSGARQNPFRFGREGGWKARYRRAGGSSTAGPLIVESRVDLFRSGSGAKDDLALYATDFAAVAPSRAVPVEGIGQAGTGSTSRQIGLHPTRFYRIAWREHNATASVVVQGFDGKVSLADATALARRQERRLRAAFR